MYIYFEKIKRMPNKYRHIWHVWRRYILGPLQVKFCLSNYDIVLFLNEFLTFEFQIYVRIQKLILDLPILSPGSFLVIKIFGSNQNNLNKSTQVCHTTPSSGDIALYFSRDECDTFLESLKIRLQQ